MNNLDFYVAFCDKLDNGEFDTKLTEILKMVQARRLDVKQALKVEDFSIGDRISINDFCGTKSLRGETGSVIGIRRKKIKITLDNPKGNFIRVNSSGQKLSAEVIVPLEIVDKL